MVVAMWTYASRISLAAAAQKQSVVPVLLRLWFISSMKCVAVEKEREKEKKMLWCRHYYFVTPLCCVRHLRQPFSLSLSWSTCMWFLFFEYENWASVSIITTSREQQQQQQQQWFLTMNNISSSWGDVCFFGGFYLDFDFNDFEKKWKQHHQ